jgi:hypothetical protein
MNPSDPMEMFRALMGAENRDPNAGKDYDPVRVAQAAEKLNTPKEKPLAVGDKVIWKEGMKNRRFPPYGCQVIVTHILTLMERLALIEGRAAKEGTAYPAELSDFVGVVAVNAPCEGRPEDDSEPYPMEFFFDSRFWNVIG